MSYQILRTDKADEQLRDIIFYIADDSGSVDIALNYLEKIENQPPHSRDFSHELGGFLSPPMPAVFSCQFS